MKDIIYMNIFDNDKLGVIKILKGMPNVWEELEQDRTDGIVQKFIDDEIKPKAAYRQLLRVYGHQSVMAVQLTYMYGNVVDKKKLKSKTMSISIPIYLYDKLRCYKDDGGQMSQLIAATLDMQFDVMKDSSIELQKFVNKWLGDRFRDKKIVQKEREKVWTDKAAEQMKTKQIRDRKRKHREAGIEATQGVPMKKKRPTSTMDAELKADDDFKGQSHEEILALIAKQKLANSKVDKKDAKKKTKK